MPLLQKLTSMERPKLSGLVAPFVVLFTITISIAISPWFDWMTNALSDLGNYNNGVGAAIIFNIGLVSTGLLEISFLHWFVKRLKDPIAKISMGSLAVSSAFLVSIGILSENAGGIHFWVSVGFFLFFPISMWIMGIDLMRFAELRWLAVISLLVPFFSLYVWWITFVGTAVWSGMAIPEILTASTVILWFLGLWYLHDTSRLNSIAN